MDDNKLLLLIAGSVIVLTGLATRFWPRVHNGEFKGPGFLRLFAVLTGAVILFFSTSVDRKNVDLMRSELASTQESANKAELARKEVETQLIAAKGENKDLQQLLKQSSAEKQAAANEAKIIRAALLEAVNTVAEVIPDSKGNPTRIRIRETVLFKQGKADLDCNSRETLSKVIGFVVYQLKTTSASQLKVDGHASSEGDDERNKELSLKRATTVKDYLVGAGVPPTIIESRGFGKEQPAGFTEPRSPKEIADANSTESARQKNRRVELLLVSP